jgi:ring-1,2-phenylacetyl-CoA epoxidase subunit PaaA
MVQDAVNRWWWPVLMMFGPPDADAPTAPSPRSGIKRISNDDLRQKFVDATVPRPRCSASRCPTPTSSGTRRAHYDYGQIDWAEFWRVVKATALQQGTPRHPRQGPRGRRMGARSRAAHEAKRRARAEQHAA